MKKNLVPAILTLTAILLCAGCAGPDIKLGGGSTTITQKPTLGQQLVDLKQARDKGALTEEEFQAQKNRLLEQK